MIWQLGLAPLLKFDWLVKFLIFCFFSALLRVVQAFDSVQLTVSLLIKMEDPLKYQKNSVLF